MINPSVVSQYAEFNDALARFCKHFCAPLGWLMSSDGSVSLLETNGTCTLVNTGEKQIFVTCHHVWAGWDKYRKQHANAVLLLGLGTGVPLDLTSATLLDKDKDLDLAVFETKVAHWREETKGFYPIETWPIPLPVVGEIVAVVGFPGADRINAGVFGCTRITAWTAKIMCYEISSVSNRNIVLAPERKDRKSYDKDGNEKPHDYLGGMSGSPAFVLRIDGPPMLAGFLYEGEKSDDFIFLRPASYLQPNGTLRGG